MSTNPTHTAAGNSPSRKPQSQYETPLRLPRIESTPSKATQKSSLYTPSPVSHSPYPKSTAPAMFPSVSPAASPIPEIMIEADTHTKRRDDQAQPHEAFGGHHEHMHIILVDPAEQNMAISLFKECIEHLSLIQEVSVNVMKEKNDFKVRFGKEIDKIIEQQHELQKRYSRLLYERQKLFKMMANGSMINDIGAVSVQMQENDLQRQEIRDEIRNKRDILDQFFARRVPNIENYVGKISRQINTTIKIVICLMKSIAEGKPLSDIDELLSQEGESTRKQIGFLLSEENRLAEKIEMLKEQTVSIVEDSKREFHEMDTLIANLEFKLRAHRKMLGVYEDYVHHQYSMDVETANKLDEMHMENLLDEKAILGKKMEVETKCENYTTTYLERRKADIDEEKEKWTEKQSRDVSGKTKEINLLKVKLEDLRERRRLANIRYEDYGIRIEKIRAHRQQQRLNVLFEAAATLIQASWRGYATRKRFNFAFTRRRPSKRDTINESNGTARMSGPASPKQTESSPHRRGKEPKPRKKVPRSRKTSPTKTSTGA